MLVSQLDNNNYFVCLCDDYGGSMPHGCIAATPPPFPWEKQWAQWNGKKFVMLPDHRQRRAEEGFAPGLVQEATEYWLPVPYGEDTHQSPARTMTERGPLPEGAQLTRPEKSFEQVKTTKLQEINGIYEQQASLVRIDVPENEVLTWDIQKLEAEAWQKNPEVSTPFIDTLAASREMDRDTLLVKVLEKASAYRNYIGALTGTRQKLEDKVNAATTKEELETIVWPNQ